MNPTLFAFFCKCGVQEAGVGGAAVDYGHEDHTSIRLKANSCDQAS